MAASKRVLVDVVEAGRKGGVSRREKLTPAELKRSSQVAIRARWDAYYAAHPEKLAAKLAKEAAKSGKVPKKAKKAAKKR